MSEFATKKQTYTLFCACKVDARPCNLPYKVAYHLIGGLNDGTIPVETARNLLLKQGAIDKQVPKKDWVPVHNEAHDAGIKAGNQVPAQSVPGTAWFTIHPGTCAFARWAKENLGGLKATKGVQVPIGSSVFQSVTQQFEYAKAYVEVLEKHKVEAKAEAQLA